MSLVAYTILDKMEAIVDLAAKKILDLRTWIKSSY